MYDKKKVFSLTQWRILMDWWIDGLISSFKSNESSKLLKSEIWIDGSDEWIYECEYIYRTNIIGLGGITIKQVTKERKKETLKREVTIIIDNEMKHT